MTKHMTWPARIARLDQNGRKRLRLNAEREAKEADPKRAAEAEAALAALDDSANAEREMDRAVANGPLFERVKRAFERIPPSEKERKLVQAVLDRPGSSSAALSRRIGYGNMAWQLHFGIMCRERSAILGPPASLLGSGEPFWSGLLCHVDEHSSFSLKPEAEAAFRQLGFRTSR